ncbi:septum formation initiator family protein [Flavobacterium sp. NST-5]|uniref:Septum formation initiator family protein n=1 Tax=Flavobacterium ichthyis TaxID=2698827 RepID=A0ABW9ZBC0_9FLAO|nr:septum formation initiator family protein [Flavobacterium ichthyis]NBL65879.1 septum formation initiator family protein [Flavobacterium ichthyis]
MKKLFKKSTEKKTSWLKIISNRYVLVTVFFVIWMIFLDNYSFVDQKILNKELKELEDNKKYYQDEIKSDQQKIKLLKNPDQIEKYAREKYYMKRDSEDIYIIEFDEDLPPDEESKTL